MSVDTYQVQPDAVFTAVIGGMPSESGAFSPSYPPPGLKPALGAPLTAPAAAASAAAGNLGVGTYRYLATFVSAYGETGAGPEIAAVTSAGHQQVALTAIALGPAGTTGRKLYRTVVGGAAGSEQLLAVLANNTATTFTDNVADSGLGSPVPLHDNSGQLGVQIVPLAGGTPVTARSTSGILEQLPNSAIYAVDLTAPTYTGLDSDPGPTGDYTVLWDYNQGSGPFFTQTLSVDVTIPVTPSGGSSNSPVYVQQADVIADPIFTAPGAQTPPADSDEFNALIVQCELEIDSIIGFWIRDPTTGRKINMTNIVPVAPISPFPGELFAPYQRGVTIFQKAALQRAVIAQIEFHLTMGPDWFRRPQYQTVSGPQFSRSWGTIPPPMIAPKARQFLASEGIVRMVARALV